jgi:hypothetical protein
MAEGGLGGVEGHADGVGVLCIEKRWRMLIKPNTALVYRPSRVVRGRTP